MSINIEQIAKLARLESPSDPAKAAKFNDSFASVMKFVDTINEVNTEGVPPMTSLFATTTPEREDKITTTPEQRVNFRNTAQKNAPKAEMGFYVVPKIVE